MHNTLEELFAENQVWSHIYTDLYLRIKDNAYTLKIEAIDVFNEVYSQCRNVWKDQHPEDCFEGKYWNCVFHENSPITRRYESNLCLSLIYVALSLCKWRNDTNIRAFRTCLEMKMKKERETCFFPHCVEFVKNYSPIHQSSHISDTQILPTNSDVPTTTNKIQNSDSIQVMRQYITAEIEYAEKFPWNENSKAEVIKSLLLAKETNNHIPQGVITDEMRKRIMNLGRKEAIMQVGTFKADAYYDIHNNEKVFTKE